MWQFHEIFGSLLEAEAKFPQSELLRGARTDEINRLLIGQKHGPFVVLGVYRGYVVEL